MCTGVAVVWVNDKRSITPSRSMSELVIKYVRRGNKSHFRIPKYQSKVISIANAHTILYLYWFEFKNDIISLKARNIVIILKIQKVKLLSSSDMLISVHNKASKSSSSKNFHSCFLCNCFWRISWMNVITCVNELQK